MAEAAFVSWVAGPGCKSLDSAMQALNKAWHRYNEMGAIDEKVTKQIEKSILGLDKTAAAMEFADMEICSVILEEIREILELFAKDKMPTFGFDAISYALVRLPTYIRLVASGAPNLSASLFDVLNVIRMANGKGPHASREWIERIDFSEVQVRRGKEDVSVLGPKLTSFLSEEVVPSLPMFLDNDDLFLVLDEAEKRLTETQTANITQRQSLFTWLIQCVVSNAKRKRQRLDLLTVLCLAEACKTYVAMFKKDNEEADQVISDDFLYLLILMIGFSTARSESSEKLLERLDVANVFHQAEDVEKVRTQLAGADLSSMEDVYPVLLEDLNSAGRLLNLSVTRGRFKPERTLSACESIGRIAGALEVVGDQGLASELKNRNNALAQGLESKQPYEDLATSFDRLAEAVVFVKRSLDEKIHGGGADIFADLPLDRSVIHAFLKEARADLRIIRQKLGLHFETGEAHSKLMSAVRNLGILSSSLTIIDLGDTANVIRHLAIYLHDSISNNEPIGGENLKLMASSLTAIEMRLEYLNKGLIPPKTYIDTAKAALSELLGEKYSSSLPALPKAFLSSEESEEASAKDMLPLVHGISEAAEKWDGSRDETWDGLKNLFAELASVASLLEYRLVTRLARDVTDLAHHIDDVGDWDDELSEQAFEFVNEIAKTLVLATGDDPHLPDNCVNDLMVMKDTLLGHLIPTVEADQPLEIDEAPEGAEVEQETPQSSDAQAEPDVDEELIAIFDKEYKGLSKALMTALEDFQEVPEAAVPTDKLIHTCHTLKGVSHTIERPEMSEVFGIWEDLCNERQADNVALNDDEIALFEETVNKANVCVAGLRRGMRFPESESLIERLREAYESEPEIGSVDAEELEAVAPEEVEELEAPATDSQDEEAEQEPEPESDSGQPILDPDAVAAPEVTGVDIEGFTPHDGDYDDEMLGLYLEEAASELYKLDDFIADLDANPTDEDLHVDIKRLMHTLKGSSNMAGASTIGFITHELEELLSGVEVGSIDADPLFVRLLAAALDILRKLTQIAEQREQLPSPWHLLAAIQYGNENDELDETLVNNGLKESLNFGTEPASTPATGSEPVAEASENAPAEVDETTEPESQSSPTAPQPVESAKPIPIESAKKTAKRPASQPKVKDTTPKPASKVKRITTSVFDIKEGESFNQTLDRLRSLRQEQRQSGSGAEPTPPKVKVDTNLLDQLIDSAFEVNVDRDRVVHYQENMERSESVLRKLTDHIETMQAALANELNQIDAYHRDHPEILQPDYLDHFSALQALCRDLGETTVGVRSTQEQIKEQTGRARTTTRKLTKTTRSLRENLFNTRLVPVRNMLSSLRTVTNKTGDMVGKKLSFEMEGESTQIDRNLLDTLTSNRALEHLIRNSADHGIEDPETRKANGKPETGSIILKAQHEGDRIYLKLRDDGAGIDPSKVKAKAVEKGLIEPDADLSHHEVLQLITSSGFSTAASVTQVSGRGVGMDVVRSTIENLGGSLSINSELGSGTEFVLDLPYTQGVSRALVVGVGEAKFAIPTTAIESFGYVPKGSLTDSTIDFEGSQYDWMSLMSLCGLMEEPSPFLPGERVGIVIIKNAGKSFAVACDSIDGMQALHLKQVPFFKDSLRGVLGLADTIEGKLLTVIDPRELRFTMVTRGENGFKTKPKLLREAPLKNKPLAIVADDSVALRKSATRFLERMGYQVRQAVNGREALLLMETSHPSILVTDLEMPQMDGFELTRNVRGLDQTKDLPIVMVTSRNTGEIERTAFEAGVSCFLPKPFNAEMLADAVEKSSSMEVRVG